MDQVPKPEKPYRFDTIPKPVTPTDYAMWEATLWDYLRSIKRNKKLLRKNLTWTLDEDTRGFVDDNEGPEASRLSGEDKAEILESILLKIGTYGPKSIFIDITKRSTGYKYIFDAIKRVCGFPVPGAQLIHYMCVKHGFDTSGSETYNDFYWRLRDEKIASLMTRESGVTFRGVILTQDEAITPMMENTVVTDWLEAIGGIKLVKYIGQEYAKELEKMSIFDLQETIGQQETMKSILDRMESEEVVKLNRAQAGGGNAAGRSRREREKKTYEKRWCYFCEELKNGKKETHNTEDCFHRKKNKKKIKGFKVAATQESESPASSDDEGSDTDKMAEMLEEMKEREANQ